MAIAKALLSATAAVFGIMNKNRRVHTPNRETLCLIVFFTQTTVVLPSNI